MSERIAMFGAGALGGYVGGYLATTGRDVVLTDMWHANIEAIRSDGLHLSGMGDAEALVARPETLHMHELGTELAKRPIDIAFISVKSYDTEWVTQLAKPYLSPAGFIVSLQNGINEERIAGIVGWGRTIGCIASSIAVELYAPGHIRRQAPKGASGHTVFRVGEVHGRVTPRATRIAEMLAVIDGAKVTTNLWGERWSKLSQNAMRNGLSAVTGLNGADMDRNADLRGLSIAIAGEAVRIGRALGYELEPLGKLDPDRVLQAADGDREAFSEIDGKIAAQADTRGAQQRASMGQDVLKGRRTEIDDLNGLIAAKGEAIGIPAPANRWVTEMVHKVTRGEIAPSPQHLASYR